MTKVSAGANLSSCVISVTILYLQLSLNVVAETTGEYHYLELGLTWPHSFCNAISAGCSKVPPWFVISGFRPMYSPDIPVLPYNFTGCELNEVPPEKLEVSHYSGLIDKMEKHWPSLDWHGTNQKLWQKDWWWHGRCFNEPAAPGLYFETGLNLEKETDILDILDKGGIAPTGAEYNISQIKSVIEKSLEVEVRVTCNLNNNLDVYQFLKVNVCFARNRERQDCEPLGLTENTCGNAPGGMVTFDVSRDH